MEGVKCAPPKEGVMEGATCSPPVDRSKLFVSSVKLHVSTTDDPSLARRTSQDDSAVYATSKRLCRLRPVRRGESFNLRPTGTRTSVWPPPSSAATCEPPLSSTRRQHHREVYTSQLNWTRPEVPQHSQHVPSTSPRLTEHTDHVHPASARMTEHTNMQNSNSAPNFQRCSEKVDLRCSSESAMPHFGHQGLTRSAAPWTPGGTTPKSSPIAVVRPHELQRKNRHWSVVSPVSRGSQRHSSFESHGSDDSPHSHQGDGYASGDPMRSLQSKHSFSYDLSDHKSTGSIQTGNIPYDGQFSSCRAPFAPSPPLPPVRDSSSLKYTRIGQTHEKYPSWPVTAANQERDETSSSVCSNSRTNSWSEPTTTTSSGEFPMKPNKMVYQPRLRHIEEKVTSDSLRRHLEENGVKSQKQLPTGEVLEAVAAHMTSESRLKNFDVERSYPRYDHEGVLRDSKNYTVPSPPERDVTVFTATSCQPHHQWGHDTRPIASWDSHTDYSASASVRSTYDSNRGTNTSPTRTVAANRSSTESFSQVAPLASPTSLPPEILGSRNVSVKYIVRTSKPYYNTGTQTDDLETGSGDVMSHELKSPMAHTVVEKSKSASDVAPRKAVKDASTGVPLVGIVGRVESFYDNAPRVGEHARETHGLRDSEQQTVNEQSPLDVAARTTTLTAPLHYTAPSAIGATARNTLTATASLGGTTRHSAHLTLDERPSLPLTSASSAFRNSAPQAMTSPSGAATTKDYDGTSLQWTQPQTAASQEFSPLHDDFLAQIHEHSPSQTQMLRKLSQEFYGSRLQQHNAFAFNQPRKMEPLPLSTTHEVAAPAPTPAPTSQSSTSPSDVAQNVSNTNERGDRNWERLANMSLRKAYGTDDSNHPGASSEKFHKSLHGRSVSTSHMLKQKTSPPPQASHKGQSSLDSSSKITRRVKDFVGSLWGGAKATTDTRKIAEDARRDWERRDMPRKIGTPSKLKRTTSEQIRPIKERSKERLRVKDMYAARSGKESDASYHKPLDDLRTQSAKHSHHSSDPSDSDPFTSDGQKRISGDCDVFLDPQEQHGSLRPGSTRSTASSGSIEDRHNNSDPQLKKFQQRAVLSFFEEKTGKRMSSSSIDSSETTPWQVAPPPVDEEPRKETMKKSLSLPSDVLQGFHRHGRSSSGNYRILREAEKIFPDTSFGDDTMSPPLLDIPPGDPTALSLSPVSSVSSPTTQEYSPPLHPWDKDAESRTQSTDYRPAPLSTAQHRKSETERKSAEYRDQLSEKTDQETHPKTTYDYSSSSGSNSSPVKSANEIARKFTYNLAVTESYVQEEGEESPPPTLPPRNYRQKHDASSRGESRHVLPPPPPGGDTAKGEVGAWDYDSTPKADSYANQVRQQAYRLSQSHSSLLSAGRHPSKVSPDIKTGVSISRPVDKPPTPQEALVPQPRSHVEPRSHADSDAFRLEMNIAAAASYSSTALCPPEGPVGASPVPSSGGSVFLDDNPLLSLPPGGGFDRTDARQTDTDERTSASANTHHSESFLFRNSGGHDQARHDLDGGQGHARHDFNAEGTSPQLASVSSAPILTSDVDQSLTTMATHTQPPWMSAAHKVVNPSHRVRSMSPERGASTEWGAYPERGSCPVSEGDTEERLSVHALLSNFEKKGSSASCHRVGAVTDGADAALRSDTSPRTTSSSTENLSPVMHSKVSQIRETLLRKSTENLLQSEYHDSSLRISPGTPPQQRRRESTGSPAMASVPQGHHDSSPVASVPHGHHSPSPTASAPQGRHSPSPVASVPHRHSPCSSPKSWRDTNVSDVRAFTHTYKSRDSTDSLSDVAMTTASSSSSITTAMTSSTSSVVVAISSPENSTASPRNNVTQKSNESLASSLGDAADDDRSRDSRANSVEALDDDTNRQKLPLVPHHRRHKSQEEQECEKHAAVLVQQLSQLDKHLCDIILPSPELKMTTDYMTGIFDTSVDVTRRPSILVKNRPEVRRRSHDKDEQGSQSHSPLPASSPYWSPPSVAQLQTKIREEGDKIDDLLKDVGDADTSLQDQKEELLGRIRKKLDILVEEKRLLDEEIAENSQLGDELTAIVQEKVENKAEYDKYQLYVSELGKVMKLLLQLSGRLARANNAINALAEGDSKQKGTLIQKRDELSEKHEDAKQLKEGIDRRSHQVAAFLKRHLLADEFTDYEHFIKMKCKLMIEQQEIDDKINLGREQLAALQRSIAESNA